MKPPAIMGDEPVFTEEMETLVAGPKGMEMALALAISGFEAIASTAVGPAQKRFATDYARMGREVLRRHGTGVLEQLDAEIVRQKSEGQP